MTCIYITITESTYSTKEKKNFPPLRSTNPPRTEPNTVDLSNYRTIHTGKERASERASPDVGSREERKGRSLGTFEHSSNRIEIWNLKSIDWWTNGLRGVELWWGEFTGVLKGAGQGSARWYREIPRLIDWLVDIAHWVRAWISGGNLHYREVGRVGRVDRVDGGFHVCMYVWI